MQIFVKTLGGSTRTLSVDASSSIADVKDAIEVNERIPSALQVLLFNGKSLEDGRSVSDYNIQAASTIQMMLSIKGGVFDPSLAALAKKFNCEKQVCRKYAP